MEPIVGCFGRLRAVHFSTFYPFPTPIRVDCRCFPGNDGVRFERVKAQVMDLSCVILKDGRFDLMSCRSKVCSLKCDGLRANGCRVAFSVQERVVWPLFLKTRKERRARSAGQLSIIIIIRCNSIDTLKYGVGR